MSAIRKRIVELKQLRLHGIAGAWTDLAKQGTHNAGLGESRWLDDRNQTSMHCANNAGDDTKTHFSPS